MHTKHSNKKSAECNRFNIVLANFTTEKNKGDATLQVSLIRMVRKNFPTAKITACSFSVGANQHRTLKAESFSSMRENIDAFVGGLQPKYVDTETVSRSTTFFDKILLKFRNIGGLVFSVFLLFCLIVRVPKSFISYLLPSAFKPTFDAFKEADVIVIKSSNIRESSFLRGPYDIFCLFYHALIGLFMHKPVAFIGGSIWPLKNRVSVVFTRFVFKRFFLITLREPISYKTLRGMLKIKNKNVYVLPDLSFYLLSNIAPNIVNKNIKYQKSNPIIGLTVMNWRDQGEVARQNYIKSLRALILYASKQYNARFVVIPQVSYKCIQGDSDDILDAIVEGKCANHVRIIKPELSIEDLLSVYANLDFLIATSLHSAIFAASVGVPALVITYEGGPKARGILATLGLQDVVLDYGSDSSVVVEQFERLWNNRAELIATAANNLPRLYEEVNSQVLIMKKLLTQNNM